MEEAQNIAVEVAYALPTRQKIISLMVTEGTSAYDAVRLSGIEQYFPELQLDKAVMGIFGQAFGTKGLDDAKEYLLKPGDRIEIYRPLTADPKDARKKRAEKRQIRQEQPDTSGTKAARFEQPLKGNLKAAVKSF